MRRLEPMVRRWGKALLPLYHRLPAPARDVAVSLRGWPLARLRRSAWVRAEVALGAHLERDAAAAAATAAERLRGILVHAAGTVPYYSRLFAERGLDPSRLGPADLARLPLLERPVLRARWAEFQSRAVLDRTAIVTSTSGTTAAASASGPPPRRTRAPGPSSVGTGAGQESPTEAGASRSSAPR